MSIERVSDLFVQSHIAREGGRVLSSGNLPPETSLFTPEPCSWGRLLLLINISKFANCCVVCGINDPAFFSSLITLCSDLVHLLVCLCITCIPLTPLH